MNIPSHGPQIAKSVLMLGSTSTPILEPLARCLKAVDPALSIEVCGLRQPGNTNPIISEFEQGCFSKCHTNLSDSDGGNWRRNLISFLKGRSKENSSPKSLSNPKGKPQEGFSLFRFITLYIFAHIAGIRYSRKLSKFQSSIDLIHLQSLVLADPHCALLLKSEIPFIVSCWGSDVLRESNPAITALQQKVLNRAAAITVTGSEFKEVVLSKYGRHLAPKIFNTFFDPNIEEVAIGRRKFAREAIISEWNMVEDAICICIGHNGLLENNHIELIESLKQLDVSQERPIHLVVPMTYGADESHFKAVKTTLEASEITHTLLSEFLTNRQTDQLRLATDIFIYAPISDAFSGTVSQCIASGSACILGSWLPYKARLQAGFKYWEIDTPSEAGKVVNNLVKDWPRPLSLCETNRPLSIDFFSRKRIGRAWIETYNEALEMHCLSKYDT